MAKQTSRSDKNEDSDHKKQANRQVESRQSSGADLEGDIFSGTHSSSYGEVVQSLAERLSDRRISTIQRHQIAQEIAHKQGNQVLLKVLDRKRIIQRSRAKEARRKRGKEKKIAVASRVSGSLTLMRVVLGDLTDAYDNIQVRTRTIDNWKTFLKNADIWEFAMGLNAFMAKAVGHTVFDQDSDRADRDEQARTLRRLTAPSPIACRNLMVAMLTTRGVDLREIGYSPAVTGYLIPRFISSFYQSAINYIAEQAGRRGEYENWRINPTFVAGFLDEAGDVFGETRALEPRYGPDLGGMGGGSSPNRLGEIGVSGSTAGASPIMSLQAQALAGAQAAVGAAHGEAMEEGSANGATIAEEYGRHVTMHALVLSGIVQEQDRIHRLNEAIVNAAIGVVFSAAGPFVGQLSVFGRVISETTSLEAGASAAMEVVKTGVTGMANGLAGKSGSELRSAFRNSFDTSLQEYLNEVRSRPRASGEDPVPEKVGTVNRALRGAFDFHTD